MNGDSKYYVMFGKFCFESVRRSVGLMKFQNVNELHHLGLKSLLWEENAAF